MKVLILLCTYNGQKFIVEQLESLLAQTYSNWVCYAFDDCSTDETVAILKNYANEYPGKFFIRVNETPSGSAAKNFAAATTHVFENVGFDLLCYCDQDDVWATEKISKLVSKFSNLSIDEPTLVFSDLAIVNSNLEVIKTSFVGHISVGKSADIHIRRGLLSVDNIVPGCALMTNRALLKQALPISKQAVMHDWWLVLYAIRCGRIEYVPESLVLYRQHEKNSVGAKNMAFVEKISRLNKVTKKLGMLMNMHKDLKSREIFPIIFAKFLYVMFYKFFLYR